MKKMWENFLKLWGDDRFVVPFWLGTIAIFWVSIGFLGGILGALIGSVVCNIFDLERCIYFGIEMDAVPR